MAMVGFRITFRRRIIGDRAALLCGTLSGRRSNGLHPLRDI